MSAICQTHSAAAAASSSVTCLEVAGQPILAARLQRGRWTSLPKRSHSHMRWFQVGARSSPQCGHC
eukprot:3512277-Alexandrium_andersonii.AAC.1